MRPPRHPLGGCWKVQYLGLVTFAKGCTCDDSASNPCQGAIGQRVRSVCAFDLSLFDLKLYYMHHVHL